MDGHRHAVTSADGTGIGLLTADDAVDVFGQGPGRRGPGPGPAHPGLDQPGLAREIAAELPGTLAVLDGQGHDAIDAAPAALAGALEAFLS